MSAKLPVIVAWGAALAFEAPAFFVSLVRGTIAGLAAVPRSPDYAGTVSRAAAPVADFEQLAPELGRGFKEGGTEELDAFSPVTLDCPMFKKLQSVVRVYGPLMNSAWKKLLPNHDGRGPNCFEQCTVHHAFRCVTMR